MATKYAAFIKAVRISKGFSQQETADKLGISRGSYLSIEKGDRELSLSEADSLAALFGITVNELIGASIADLEKYKQMILAYLRGDISSDGKITKTKLAKLLYLADFAWFYEHLQSMSGMPYRRIQYGPVPDLYFRAIDELENEGRININRKGDSLLISQTDGSVGDKLNNLNAEEIKIINSIARKWKDKKTQEIVHFTHEQLPYKLCAPDEIIPYELITQEDPDHVY